VSVLIRGAPSAAAVVATVMRLSAACSADFFSGCGRDVNGG
jgi:hypothetical protein